MSTTKERLASRNQNPVTIEPGQVLNIPTALQFANGNPLRPWIVTLSGPCPFLQILQTNENGSFDIWNPTGSEVTFNWTAHHLHSEEREPLGAVDTNPTPSTVQPPQSLCDLPYATDAELAAETAARIAGDAALQANIDAEEAARIAGDAALQANIDAETAARIAADAALQAQIDASVAAIYGEMYQYDNAVLTPIALVNQWTKVVNFQAGHLDFVSYLASALILPRDGDYKVIWTISCTGAANNKNWEFSIGVDGAIQNNTKQKRFIASLDTGAIAGHGIIEGSENQQVDLRVRNLTDASDITIVNAQVTVQFIH